jgi:hypothetical protein
LRNTFKEERKYEKLDFINMTVEELDEVISMATRRRIELGEMQRRREWDELIKKMEDYISKWDEAIQVDCGNDTIYIDAPITTPNIGQIQMD